MELEKQDNNNYSFNDILEPIPISQPNKYSKNRISFIIIILILFAFIFSVFLIILKYNYFKIFNFSKFNKEPSKIKNIDSIYKRVSPNDKDFVYIPIISSNDIHGRFFPEINEINYNSNKIIYKTGGLEYISKYVNILRNEFGKNRVLYFDIGDQFFFTNETVLFDGENILDFFNKIGLNGTVLGNHEFLYKRKWLEKKIKKAKYPYITNNIIDNITNQKIGILGKNQETSHLYEIKLENNDIIRIGVIGLTLINGIDKIFYNIGNKHTWNNILFQLYEIDLEKESKKLKEKGANAIILLSHIGLICSNLSETAKINMYNKTIKQSECEHDGNSLLYNFLKKIKPGLFDAIIGGDSHNTVHHWINDIPIMISKGNSKYTNIMYLPFKKDNNNKYFLINNEIKIESPLPSCEKIFSNFNHCEKLNTEEEYKNSGELINFYWHGIKIEKDIMTKKIFDKYYFLYKKEKNKKISKFIGYNGNLKLNITGDSILGNLITDAIRNITNTDICIISHYIFRNEISTGDLSLLDFIKLFPIQCVLCTTEFTGKEIIKIIKNVQTRKIGFFPTSGLKQTIKFKKKEKEEIKQVIKIQIYNNEKLVDIDKNKIYTLSTYNKVLTEDNNNNFGKEFFEIIKDKYKKNKIKCSKNYIYRDIANYFRNKIVDISKVVDMSKPRIVIIEE